MSKKLWINLLSMAVAICAVGTVAMAQEKSLDCNDRWNSGDRAGHCVITEQAIATNGSIAVDGKKNGGISIKGWERRDTLVRAKIQTWADNKAEAEAITSQIRIETAGGNIHAEGPSISGDQSWAVSYEIFVPVYSNLSLKAHNGGIGISDVKGQIEFSTTNGGVSLKNLGGSVKGNTKNGGVSVVLSGNRWDGEGLDVMTTNGGVNMIVPENYSAHLETGTVNGGLRTDIPMMVQGEIKQNLSVNLGGGGATIRARTTNGGVSIKRKA
ncbi:MAG: DUF4097 domain-containing protein [Blastocatellales bacterium]